MVPHMHTPPLVHVSAVVPQFEHVPPGGGPQLVTDSVMQLVPEQQPVGHEVGSQTQLPETHSCPATHAAPPPQLHAPLTHWFPVEPQFTHVAPIVPHADAEGVVHVVPEQQPVGQEVALQTHAPATHSWPLAHAAPVPHVQTPFVHESALMPQAMHAPPPVPQVEAEGVLQFGPEQHPLGHVVALHPHAPAMHFCIMGQVWHAAPALPQFVSELPGRQLFPEQQPLHEVLSHRHTPIEQCCPLEHCGPPPQVQVPLEEQPSAFALQVVHAEPAVPHAETDGVSQTLPLQQPLGHEVPLQTHAPLLQI